MSIFFSIQDITKQAIHKEQQQVRMHLVLVRIMV